MAHGVYTEAERSAQLTWKAERKLGNLPEAHKTSSIQVEFQTRRWGGLIQPDLQQPEARFPGPILSPDHIPKREALTCLPYAIKQ